MFLQLGSRWARIPNVGFLRALAALIVAGLSSIPWIASGPRSSRRSGEDRCRLGSCRSWCSLGIDMDRYRANVLRTSPWRAIVAWLATLIPAIGFALLAILVVRPYMFEAFKIPTNSMAPTVLGKHWEAPCPRCGSPAFCTPEPEHMGTSNYPVLMICSRELRSCRVANPSHMEYPGDRIVVTKFIHPQRWDVIVFRLPEDPEVFLCKRLGGAARRNGYDQGWGRVDRRQAANAA